MPIAKYGALFAWKGHTYLPSSLWNASYPLVVIDLKNVTIEGQRALIVPSG